jgi:hypothetical protein
MNKDYPYYLHNDGEFIEYWKRYFNEYPITDDTKFELYIDFPFCRSICKFCAFGSNKYYEYKDKIKIYEDSVVSLVQNMKDVFPVKMDQIYFGGGTPSLWNKDALIEIINNIPGYHNTTNISFEVHPIDLTDEFLSFLINDMDIKRLSIGIQSFDLKSNKQQNRIPYDIDKLKKAIDIFHENDRYANIDIVALFNYDNDMGWDIYVDDMNKCINELKPDEICSIPNFRVDKYYLKSIKFRELLKDIVLSTDEYSLEKDSSLSLNIGDIIDYGEEPYHLLKNGSYRDFFINSKVVMDSNIDIVKNNIVMGLGGCNHSSISRLGPIQEDILSTFDFIRNKFIYKVSKTNIIQSYKETKHVHRIKVGKCTIDPSIN